jgi:hypothetical protein
LVEVPIGRATFFTLRRHHLLDRLPSHDALKAIDDILGLNAQGALNYQLSLCARVRDLDPMFIGESLKRRALVRTWMMRNTVHIVSPNLFPIIEAALRESLVEEWNRWTVRTGFKASPLAWECYYPDVLMALEDGPLTMNQLLGRLNVTENDAKRIVHRVVREMSLKTLVCHASSRGPWHHETEHTYARVDRWLPDYRPLKESEAVKELILRYLKAYGPASMQDFSYWSGMKIGNAKPIFASLKPYLEEVNVSGQCLPLLALKEDIGEIAETEPVSIFRLLPQFDSLIMGHRDKTRFLDPEYKAQIFLPTAEVAAIMLVDGRVQGVWRMLKGRKSWSLEINPFKKISEENENQLEEEIQRIRGFTGFDIERKNTQ